MNGQDGNSKYEDIINMPHHVSKTRPQMPLTDRAAQFSPFSALSGYDSVIKETARLTDQRMELDESRKAILDDKIHLIAEHLSKGPIVSITYFVPDMKKSGGSYVTVTDQVKRINDVHFSIHMVDGTIIPIHEICEIEGDFFTELEAMYGFSEN